MRAIVVYESMFGNTHEVAERIADGLRSTYEVSVLAVGEAIATILQDVDVLVVGGPTHMHGMSSSTSRQAAGKQAAAEPDLDLESDAEGPGLRDWFDAMPKSHGAAAAFDTRVVGPAMLTGRASKGIGKRLARHGFDVIAEPESFLVDKENHLQPGEADRAIEWGRQLASAIARSS